MASFSLSVASDGSSVTFDVSGLSVGDNVTIFLRYSTTTSVLVEDDFTASSASLSATYDITPGRSYVGNVRVNGSLLGAQSFTAPGKIRPEDWAWSSIYSGAPFGNLTPDQWNRFTARINEFREYAGISNYTFTTARSGTDVAACVRQAMDAINGINGCGTVPSAMELSAAFFNGLAAALNAVP